MMAIVANVNRDPKKSRPFTPDDFNPYVRRKPAKLGKVGVGVLKDVFVKKAIRRQHSAVSKGVQQ
jgi:hypothetical protein